MGVFHNRTSSKSRLKRWDFCLKNITNPLKIAIFNSKGVNMYLYRLVLGDYECDENYLFASTVKLPEQGWKRLVISIFKEIYEATIATDAYKKNMAEALEFHQKYEPNATFETSGSTDLTLNEMSEWTTKKLFDRLEYFGFTKFENQFEESIYLSRLMTVNKYNETTFADNLTEDEIMLLKALHNKVDTND